MARYKVLLKPSEYLAPEKLVVTASELPRTVAEGEYRIEGRGKLIDEGELVNVLNQLIKKWHGSKPEKSDADFALAVHGALSINRRDASNIALWTCLNATAGWGYVAWRWGSPGKVQRSRVGGGLDRSALGRLWWMAELADGSSEKAMASRLNTLLTTQDRAVQLYERPRLFRRPNLADQLLSVSQTFTDQWSEDGYREFAKACRSYFGVRLPSGMKLDEITRALYSCAEKIVDRES